VSDNKISGKTSSTFDRLAHFLRIFTVHCDGRDTIHADGDARRSQTEPRRLNVSAYYTAEARVNYIALSMDRVRFLECIIARFIALCICTTCHVGWRRPLSWCLYAEGKGGLPLEHWELENSNVVVAAGEA
jgi:hypothetical protein